MTDPTIPVDAPEVESVQTGNYRINLMVTHGGYENSGKNPRQQYYKGFHLLRKGYPRIARIMQFLHDRGIKTGNKWFFFEPYIEITWLEKTETGPQTLADLEEFVVNKLDIDPECVKTSSQPGVGFCEWFDLQPPGEKVFGARRYGWTSEIAMDYFRYSKDVDAGRGINAQYMRTIHSLANQLGMHYRSEGWYAIKRGLFCLTIWAFQWWPKSMSGYKPACWIWKKLLRQKDLA